MICTAVGREDAAPEHKTDRELVMIDLINWAFTSGLRQDRAKGVGLPRGCIWDLEGSVTTVAG